jgi:hypothetical protein
VRAPFTPDRAALAAYAGAFYSEELDVRYDLRVADSSLVMFHRKLDDSPLGPGVSRCLHTAAFGATFQFTRDRTGKVNGFTITDGRVRGVRFERMK